MQHDGLDIVVAKEFQAKIFVCDTQVQVLNKNLVGRLVVNVLR